jgi:glycosyltransferase involved in cell wall biosynthesis
MNAYIIPTIGRATLFRTTESIEPAGKIIIEKGGTASENRNRGLDKLSLYRNVDWLLFIDDDDYYLPNYELELDNEFDIVVIRMLQNNHIVPDNTDELRFANVGINFAINLNKIDKNNLPRFDNQGEGEDWRFLEKLLQDYKKVKITKEIYYIAEKRSYNLPN